MNEKILISACLLGENVKYNGKNNKLNFTFLEELKKKYELIPFCPEVEGGLPIPRVPSEIILHKNLKVINKEGKDVTGEFIKGAKKCVELVKKEGIKKALLKANSPSCGIGQVYDGSFTKVLIPEDGVTVKELKKIGVEVYDEDSFKI